MPATARGHSTGQNTERVACQRRLPTDDQWVRAASVHQHSIRRVHMLAERVRPALRRSIRILRPHPSPAPASVCARPRLCARVARQPSAPKVLSDVFDRYLPRSAVHEGLLGAWLVSSPRDLGSDYHGRGWMYGQHPRFDPNHGADTARLYAGKYAVSTLACGPWPTPMHSAAELPHTNVHAARA